jgi:hypothetical protein
MSDILTHASMGDVSTHASSMGSDLALIFSSHTVPSPINSLAHSENHVMPVISLSFYCYFTVRLATASRILDSGGGGGGICSLRDQKSDG